jgi:hypothetical protein
MPLYDSTAVVASSFIWCLCRLQATLAARAVPAVPWAVAEAVPAAAACNDKAPMARREDRAVGVAVAAVPTQSVAVPVLMVCFVLLLLSGNIDNHILTGMGLAMLRAGSANMERESRNSDRE